MGDSASYGGSSSWRLWPLDACDDFGFGRLEFMADHSWWLDSWLQGQASASSAESSRADKASSESVGSASESDVRFWDYFCLGLDAIVRCEQQSGWPS